MLEPQERNGEILGDLGKRMDSAIYNNREESL